MAVTSHSETAATSEGRPCTRQSRPLGGYQFTLVWPPDKTHRRPSRKNVNDIGLRLRQPLSCGTACLNRLMRGSPIYGFALCINCSRAATGYGNGDYDVRLEPGSYRLGSGKCASELAAVLAAVQLLECAYITQVSKSIDLARTPVALPARGPFGSCRLHSHAAHLLTQRSAAAAIGGTAAAGLRRAILSGLRGYATVAQMRAPIVITFFGSRPDMIRHG